jgi:DNA-binding transcriptional regulator YiaG
MAQNKHLSGIQLKVVRQKQRLGQALNAKEFAVLAGISYSSSREWFHIQNFPTFNGVVFWEGFVMWRQQ